MRLMSKYTLHQKHSTIDRKSIVQKFLIVIKKKVLLSLKLSEQWTSILAGGIQR